MTNNNDQNKKRHEPVYPHRVIRQSSTPATLCILVRMKYKSRNEFGDMSSSAATAFGPCTAIRARASLSRNSSVTSLPCLLNRSCQNVIKYTNFKTKQIKRNRI